MTKQQIRLRLSGQLSVNKSNTVGSLEQGFSLAEYIYILIVDITNDEDSVKDSERDNLITNLDHNRNWKLDRVAKRLGLQSKLSRH